MKRGGEGGFTLVEMMVAIVIMSIMVSVVAQSVILGLQTTQRSHERLTESVGVAFASAYFVPDVESARSVAVSSDEGCSHPGAAIARFEWVDRIDSTNVTNIATYGVRDHNGERSITRRFCSTGLPASEVVIARTISLAAHIPVCSPACSAMPSAPDTVALTIEFETGRAVSLSAFRRTS